MNATHIVNPQNPYVFDEYLFANQPHSNFNGSTFALIHRFLNVLAPSLGILSGCMVSYLAIFQTPSHIRAFSRMILLCAMADILCALSDLLCQARFQCSKAAIIFSLTGPASLFDYQVQCLLFSLKYVAYTFSYLMLPLQYIYRYQTLRQNSPPSLPKTSGYVVVGLLISLLNIWTIGESTCSLNNPNHVDFGQYWYKEVPIPQLIVAIQDYPPAVRQTTFFTIVIVVSYILTVYYARRIVTELKNQSKSMSPKTLAMQKQVGRALFAQSLVPLMTVIVPVTFGQTSLQIGVDLGYFTDIHYSLMSFFPFLNSLSTLYFILPYRNFCQNAILCCFYPKVGQTKMLTSVAPIAHLR